jgi:hypothetical protein
VSCGVALCREECEFDHCLERGNTPAERKKRGPPKSIDLQRTHITKRVRGAVFSFSSSRSLSVFSVLQSRFQSRSVSVFSDFQSRSVSVFSAFQSRILFSVFLGVCVSVFESRSVSVFQSFSFVFSLLVSCALLAVDGECFSFSFLFRLVFVSHVMCECAWLERKEGGCGSKECEPLCCVV